MNFLRTESAPAISSAPLTLPEWQPRPLPVPATPFIGRERELAGIAGRLADPGCRLLTLVGLNGMGKTRLALQAAKGHQPVFKDGVAYAALTPFPSTDFFLPMVADALNLTPSDSEISWSELAAFLASKQMLLVLDNIDHLLINSHKNQVNQMQQWLVGLLQAAPELKIIVTSHRPLHLMGEWVVEIEGLPLPDLAAESDLADNSAVTLFVNSARRVASQFVLTAGDLQSVAEICYLVDAMPLGIELAASWVRLLTCAEIVEEITGSINFLKTDLRNVPERHRSMRAVFDHSWALLLPAEKQLLARLSVFDGVFSRAAAEREAGADLESLLGLVNKSLLYRVGPGLFKLHNLVRQYAAQQLHEQGVVAGLELTGQGEGLQWSSPKMGHIQQSAV